MAGIEGTLLQAHGKMDRSVSERLQSWGTPLAARLKGDLFLDTSVTISARVHRSGTQVTKPS